jgi:hypothetical protein
LASSAYALNTLNTLGQGECLWTQGSGNNIYRKDGNVGIGTTEPKYKLDVEGDIHASRSVQCGNGIGFFNPEMILSTTGKIILGKNDNDNFDDDIHVSIGAPGQLWTTLLVKDKTHSDSYRTIMAIETRANDPLNKQAALWIGRHYQEDFWMFRTSGPGGGPFVFNHNIGIGMQDRKPTAPLEIASAYTDQQLRISDGLDDLGRFEIGYHSGNNYGRLQVWDDTAGAGDIIMCPAGGNVGIGTTQPNVKLTIRGETSSDETVFQIKKQNGEVVFEIGY